MSAASQDLFDDAVRLERIFLRYEPKVVSSDSCTYTGLVQDQIATQLLGQQWSDSTPMVVRGDGNCLFNAIFLVLFGHENASSEIRLKTFFELFDNAAFYERIHVKSFIPDISPPLASAIRQCAQIGSYSCTWTMHTASTVIGKPIKSVYPVVNGPADMNIKILNTTFKPRGSRFRHDITIMWSGGNTIGSFWKPCHFVPFIPNTVECSTINIDDYEQVMSMALFKSKT